MQLIELFSVKTVVGCSMTAVQVAVILINTLFGLSSVIGVGDGGQGDTCPPPKKNPEKFFLGNFYVKF